jgi:hypothetical protein
VSLSVGELCEGNVNGGLLYWGAPLRNLEARFVYQGLQEKVKEGLWK